MKTKEQWFEEWCEIYDTLPPYRPDDAKLVRRAKEMLDRAEEIHKWMHGYGPEPPETWQPTDPPTPEELAEAREYRKTHEAFQVDGLEVSVVVEKGR